MERKRWDVKTIYEAPVCECGWAFTERVDGMVYTSNPPLAHYKCLKCERIKRLALSDWPGFKNIILNFGE